MKYYMFLEQGTPGGVVLVHLARVPPASLKISIFICFIKKKKKKKKNKNRLINMAETGALEAGRLGVQVEVENHYPLAEYL